MDTPKPISRRSRLFAPAKYYMLEFVLMHVFLAWLAVIFSYVSAITIADILDTGNGIWDSFGLTFTSYVIAALLVVLPLAVLFSKRTRLREAMNPDIKNRKVRRFFLYLFLVGYVLTVVYTSFILLGTVVQNLATIGAGAEWGKGFWATVCITLDIIAVNALIAWYIYTDGRPNIFITKWFLKLMLIIGIVGIGFLLAFPVRTGRGAYADQKTVEDIRNIQTKVSEYANENSKLPESLDDIKLNSGEKERADENGYEYKKKSESTYQLCANFNTDTKGDEGSFSYLRDYPSYHDKGRDCFEESVYVPYNYGGGDYFNGGFDSYSPSTPDYDYDSLYDDTYQQGGSDSFQLDSF